MPGFKGQATNSFDTTKGRVAIPARMRSCLAPEAKNTLVVTRGFEQCVFVYPMDEWLKIESRIAELNPYDRKHRAFIRQFMRWAEEVVLDSKGRILLQRPLIEYAKLEKTTLVLGNQKHMEIWNPDRLDAHLNAEEADYETLAAEVMGG